MNSINQSLRCRTCFDVSEDNDFHPLAEYFPEYKKTLTDLLFYICHIDDNMESISCPTEMCESCTQRLRDAYNFALQAQRVNKEMLAFASRRYSNSLDSDSVKDEFIELTEEQISDHLLSSDEQNCALEIEILETNDSLIDSSSMNFQEEKSKDIEFKENGISDSDIDTTDPLIVQYNLLQQNKRKFEETTARSYESNMDDDKNTTCDIYECDKCDKKYKLKNSLRYHKSRIHSGASRKTKAKEDLMSDLKLDSIDQLTIQPNFINSNNENLPLEMEIHKRKRPNEVDQMINYKEFYCSKCNKKFKLKRLLIEHMKNFHSQKSKRTDELILCKICGKSQVSLVCLWCGHKFSEKKRFEMHMRRHGIKEDYFEKAICILKSTITVNGSKNIICKVCNKPFTTISALRSHLIETHYSSANKMESYSITNSLGFELDVDDSETDSDDEKNERYNVFAEKYTCEICSISFKRKYQLAKHQHANHMPEFVPLKCDKCIFKTVSQDILDHHKKTQCYNGEKQFECTKCLFKFMWKENLELHQNVIHERTDKIEECKNCIKNHFKCEKCNRKFKLKRHLIDHIENRHSDKTEKSEKPILCTICGKWFSSTNNLKSHMRSHSNEKFYKCNFCEQEFKYSTDLTKHKRKHTGEKPYKCNVCGRSFRVASNYTIHMRRHSGERPYKCSYCEKGFIDSHNLKIHIRTHTGDRPYVCGECGSSYITGSHLRKHCRKFNHSYENIEKQ